MIAQENMNAKQLRFENQEQRKALQQISIHIEEIDKRQVVFRKMAEREAAALVIRTAVTNHTLRALERAKKKHKAVTLEMKGWDGWTT